MKTFGTYKYENMLDSMCDMHADLNPATASAEVIPNAWFHQPRCTVANLLAAETEPLTPWEPNLP